MCEHGNIFAVYNILNCCFFSFLKGDMFIVHNELEDGWMWVTNVRTEEQGLIVEDLVEEVVSRTQQVYLKSCEIVN